MPCNPVLVDLNETHASGTDIYGGGGGGGGGGGEGRREEGGWACPSRCTFVLSTPIKCIVAHQNPRSAALLME